jgi:hypothetical protein
MIFVPPGVVNFTPAANSDLSVRRSYTNLLGGQYTTYALLSMRQVGEQPGRATPRYLSDWRSLPNGMFIAQAMFVPSPASFPMALGFPFPVATNYPAPALSLPYIAFDYQGQLVTIAGSFTRTLPLPGGMDIPLAHGSVFYARGADGNFINQPADVQENPPGNSTNSLMNVIHIDGITGQPKIVRQEVQ